MHIFTVFSVLFLSIFYNFCIFMTKIPKLPWQKTVFPYTPHQALIHIFA